jgi:MFS family permease
LLRLLPASGMMASMGWVIAAIVVGLALVIFWAVQLADLMSRRDEEFGGRNDKVLWFVVVFFGSFIGAIVYAVSKPPRAG